jgi:hypothetical protein
MLLSRHTRRRDFITLIGGAAAAWPLAARAQQPERVPRIGVLMASAADDSENQARMAAFLQGLAQLGWTDGRNVRIDTRRARSRQERAAVQCLLRSASGRRPIDVASRFARSGRRRSRQIRP